MRRRRSMTIAGAVAAAFGVVLLGSTGAGADGTSFGTPGPSTFTVPSGVCSVNVNALGAAGGSTFNQSGMLLGSGGNGAQAGGTVPVTPGESLGVNVGGPGDNAGGPTPVSPAGGTNGGGAGGAGFVVGASGAGGGGASDVRQASGGSGCLPPCQTVTPPSRPGSTLGDRVIVAGGGGGGGNSAPGTGTGGAGGATNAATPSGAGTDGSGLGPGGPGTGGQAGASGGAPGTGGASVIIGGGGSNGSPGATGTGGAGGDGDFLAGAGGGGGGGAVGGGGGGGGGFIAGGGGGGGGGSSLTGPTVSNASTTPGVNPGTGSVSVTFTPTAQPACAVSTGVGGIRLTG
jgi:hypothetical protein